MENLYTEDCIRTYTGLYINVFEPTPEMICIEDIAHALAQIPRFGGHLKKKYSVGQHSILAAWLAETNKLEKLLHDATEAYLGDLPTPIKKRMPEYKKVENNLMCVIAEKFGINFPFGPETKEIDKALLTNEWEHLMLQKPIEEENSTNIFLDDVWSMEQTEALFLKYFHKYYI